MNFEIDWSHEHPDFVISAPEKFYIEAVTSNKRNAENHIYKDGNGGVNEITKGYINLEDYSALIREAISRNYYKIRDKRDCYRDKYSKNEWFDKELPYIVALGSYSQEGYGREYIYPLIALLYGKYFRPSSVGFVDADSIIRPEKNEADEKVDIPLGIFLKEEYADVSAIMFSATVSLGKLSALSATNKNIIHVLYDDGNERDPFTTTSEYKEKITDGLFIFHNPLAKSPLPKSIFTHENISQFSIDDLGNLIAQGPDRHLVGRAVFCTEDKYHPSNVDKLALVNAGEQRMIAHLKTEASFNFNYYSRKKYDNKLIKVPDEQGKKSIRADRNSNKLACTKNKKQTKKKKTMIKKSKRHNR